MGHDSKSYWKDEAGAAGAEYALLLSLIGTALAVAANALGTAISTAITNFIALI
jgi:Flp pilus assembly pilin Flp